MSRVESGRRQKPKVADVGKGRQNNDSFAQNFDHFDQISAVLAQISTGLALTSANLARIWTILAQLSISLTSHWPLSL